MLICLAKYSQFCKHQNERLNQFQVRFTNYLWYALNYKVTDNRCSKDRIYNPHYEIQLAKM